MYKNFNLTESEKKQILNMHKDKGYKKSLVKRQIVELNEWIGRPDEGESMYEKFLENYDEEIRTAVVKLGKVKYSELESIPEDEWEYTVNDIISTYGEKVLDAIQHWIATEYIDKHELAKFAVQHSDETGTEKQMIIYAIEDFLRDINRWDDEEEDLDEQPQLNERIYDKEYDVVRGNPDFKTQTGRPIGNYVNKRAAAKQFQQDFQKEFPDPGKEARPYWEKDKAMPSGDSEIDTEIKRDIKVGDRWDVSKKWYGKPDPRDPNLPAEEEPKAPDVSQKYQKFSKKEELESLERKINALRGYKQEFGLDDQMNELYKNLLIKYDEDLRDYNRGGVK